MKRNRVYKLKADVEKIKELYQQGYSMIPIAKRLGIGKSTVAYHLQRLGLSRTKSQAIKLAFETGRKNHWAENHPRWKGGQRKPRNGYIFTYIPGHPRTTSTNPYVQEHILVWEKANNKALPEGWVIHHLNGVKGDNRLKNLLALPRRKHHSKMIELALKQRIRELEAEVKIVEEALDNRQAIFRISEN